MSSRCPRSPSTLTGPTVAVSGVRSGSAAAGPLLGAGCVPRATAWMYQVPAGMRVSVKCPGAQALVQEAAAPWRMALSKAPM